jgi:type II secretory pathway pseudopilin PulG
MHLRGWQACAQSGFTYLWVLVAVAILGIGLTAAAEVWSTSVRRQKLAELEWIGTQFVQAIGSYYESTPGSAKAYPSGLQDLLQDRRYLTIRRHLRTIYANPFTGKADWELLMTTDGKVRGVRATVPGESSTQVKEFWYRPGT